MSVSGDRSEQLDRAIADYLRRRDRGEFVQRERFLQSHKSLSPELGEFLSDLEYLQHLIDQSPQFHDSSEETLPRTAVRSSFIRLDTPHGDSDQQYQFGDYDLLQELGRGGMGIVFRARQRSLNRIVCIKMMLMSERAELEEFQRFRAEAMAIARLRHPNIVAIYEVGQHNGTPYYTMEFVEGVPLSKFVSETTLPLSRIAQLLRQIAEAIHAAHENGIVHRDLKPSNVLVDQREQVHITDFGVAKQLESEQN